MEIEYLHKELLDLLTIFDSLCREHGIRYSLHGGTLLGAVRNHGFIPWDDDADIMMMRKDFDNLRSLLKDEQSCCLRGQIKYQIYQKENPDVWVDIFVCDYISSNTAAQKFKIACLTALDVINRNSQSVLLSDLSKYTAKKRFAFHLLYQVGRWIPGSFKAKMYDFVSRHMWPGKNQFLIRTNDQYAGRKIIMSADWMRCYQDICFEGHPLMVTNKAHEILCSSYGPTYMTPVRTGQNEKVHDFIRKSKTEV